MISNKGMTILLFIVNIAYNRQQSFGARIISFASDYNLLLCCYANVVPFAV